MKSPLFWSIFSIFLMVSTAFAYFNIEHKAIETRFDKDWMPKDIAFYFRPGYKVEFGYLKTFSGEVTLTGELLVFDDKGHLRVKEYYKDGSLHGKKLVYKIDEKERVYKYRELTYENGMVQGVERKYHDNGKLFMESNYKNGYKSGISKQWYKSGGIYKISDFKNGILISEVKVYREDGSLKTIIPIVDGKPSYEDRMEKPQE